MPHGPAAGAKAFAVEVDVTKAADVKRMLGETVGTFGRIHVLLNNAGYGIAGSVNTASVVANVGIKNRAAYCAS